MLPSFCNDTITRIRPGTTVSRGSTIYSWSAEDVSTKKIYGCSMQPATTSLTTDGRVLGITDTYTLIAPPDADIEAGDRIEYNGNVYEIDGDVRRHPAPLMLEHIEITLRRYHG